MSGMKLVTVAAIGSIIMPYMLKAGYSRPFTLATIASGGWLGIIIPPSIPMVLYGMSTGVSVGDMFLAGIIPGIMLALGMSVYAVIYGVRNFDKIEKTKFSLKKPVEGLCGCHLGYRDASYRSWRHLRRHIHSH